MEEPTIAGGKWPVYGHRWAVAHLARSLETDEAHGGGPRHAYLFTGQKQIGKSTLVRAFVRALLCTGASAPCGECRSCRLMDHGTHPDLVLVAPMEKDPEKSKADERLDIDRVAGKLYVSQGREIVRTAQLRPVEGRYKVFHIQDAQLAAGHEFFSVLLKTLEEPPPHVILCITATERATVLPTVVSRCQPIEMQPLTVEQVTSALSKGWGATAEDADLLARLSGGRLGWAVEQLAGKSSLADRRSQMGEMLALLGADRCERLAAAERYAQWKQGMGVLDLWISWWRDLLLLQNECGDGISNVDLQPVLQSQAAALGRDEVRRYVDTVTQVTQWVKTTNVNKRLALDVLMLQMPRMKV